MALDNYWGARVAVDVVSGQHDLVGSSALGLFLLLEDKDVLVLADAADAIGQHLLEEWLERFAETLPASVIADHAPHREATLRTWVVPSALRDVLKEPPCRSIPVVSVFCFHGR